MNYDIKKQKAEYKCAGANCSNLGQILVRIRYKKQGYFCNSCAEDVLHNELAMTDQGHGYDS
jgi:hypothetical protein